MKEAIIKIIQEIINSIRIDSDRNLFYNDSVYNTYRTSQENIVSNDMLFENLQHLIYTEFYTKGEKKDGKSVVNGGIVNNDEIKHDFIEKLREANSSQERWDKNWKVDSVDPMGSVHIKKGNNSRYTFPGEFIKESYLHRVIQKDDMVKLIVRKEFNNTDEAFYFVFGDSIAEDNYQYLIRFYFNIDPDVSAKLIALITKEFNKYFIPFQFKCLNDPSHYTRCDAAVLYITKRYSKVALLILLSIYFLLKKYFRPSVPLFTLKLADGFAFAENPLNPEDSFGISRSKLITSGILSAVNSKTEKNEWVNTVLAKIEKEGYSLENFHLNPGSKFQYHFPSFN